MKREELEHVLRASAAITLDNSFVVIGSQAVLLDFPDAPAELLLSNEVDLYPATKEIQCSLSLQITQIGRASCRERV